jgi:hypothetical protein
MTKLTYNEVSALQVWERSTAREIVSTRSEETDFANLKSKAEGVRRMGYSLTVTKFTTAADVVLFRGEYQTTLNGSRYQSCKDTDYYTTEAEVNAHLSKTVAGALKRYAKLATDPASKIEKRWTKI